jgi:alpha-tubulin suppressor-like RCC1 family protein
MGLVASGCAAVQLVSAAPASAAQSAATTITAGYTHACMVRSGKAYCWGDNTYGELGNNSTASSSVPVAVYTGGVLSGLTLTQITAGNGFTCALASTGAAYCWGYNVDGELGNGAALPGAQQNTPVAVSGSLSFTQMSAGEYSMCALTSGNVAYCWGQNTAGQLGNGSTTNTSTPVQEGPVNEVSIGGLFSCAISTAAGGTYCTGQGTSGQLGNGSTANSLTPVEVTGSSSYSQIDAGFNHACALSMVGAAYCWGDNTYGEDGNSTSPRRRSLL